MRFLRRSSGSLMALVIVATAASVSAAEIEFPVSSLTLNTESGSHPITVEVAKTPEQRQRGLMFRTELDADKGMIFDFGQTRPASMWMANTLIPLDMVFIRADGSVASIHANAEPESKAIISSKEPVLYVLELAGGQAAAYSLEAGDTVTGPALTPAP